MQGRDSHAQACLVCLTPILHVCTLVFLRQAGFMYKPGRKAVCTQSLPSVLIRQMDARHVQINISPVYLLS